MIIFLKMRKISLQKIFIDEKSKSLPNPYQITHFRQLCFIFHNLFFSIEKKVEKIFESLYRCRIFRRIYFSHRQGILSCVWFPNSALKLKITIWSSNSHRGHTRMARGLALGWDEKIKISSWLISQAISNPGTTPCPNMGSIGPL